MIKKNLILGFVAIMFGLFPMVNIVRAAAGSEAPEHFRMAESSGFQTYRFGPYATVDRANQVANYARRRGYNARIIYAGSFYAGTRQYYVDVWR